MGRYTWYPYYAGYSPIFVQQVIERASLCTSAIVCDPWNGAGTTTQVAHDLGYLAVGFDLNPVMVVVARSRLVMPAQIPILCRNLEEILKHIDSQCAMKDSERDPLNLWLQPCATIAVRHIENAIREVVHGVAKDSQEPSQPWNVSIEVAFFFTAVFRCLFRLSKQLRTSNPTWLKVPRNPESRISFSSTDFIDIFKEESSRMLSSLKGEPSVLESLAQPQNVRLDVASSRALPLENREVNIVITSPPYCTRIDYAVLTSLELAFLGFDYKTSVRKLRERMIGTSTIRDTINQSATHF